ncbi:MAG: hypothetical protein AAGF32_00180 [Pseudomonadota bacterium]
MSRADKYIAGGAIALCACLGLVALVLQVQFAETLYLKRVIATLAGCW